MPKSWTEDGNYEQNREYRATAQRAREEKEMIQSAVTGKRRTPRSNPNSLPGKSKWFDFRGKFKLPRRGDRHLSDAGQKARHAQGGGR